ncbi:hypothetical protein OUZ56_031807 [Daphnia magna]|uniref:Uncharacterized protein n=1 Tax=Daphnia magna TaxID=35525 RepID=A0ABQ9ZW07_9CRUS|nr:hypothetical protein OUZ56_031807 [Daphnia magna]
MLPLHVASAIGQRRTFIPLPKLSPRPNIAYSLTTLHAASIRLQQRDKCQCRHIEEKQTKNFENKERTTHKKKIRQMTERWTKEMSSESHPFPTTAAPAQIKRHFGWIESRHFGYKSTHVFPGLFGMLLFCSAIEKQMGEGRTRAGPRISPIPTVFHSGAQQRKGGEEEEEEEEEGNERKQNEKIAHS